MFFWICWSSKVTSISAVLFTNIRLVSCSGEGLVNSREAGASQKSLPRTELGAFVFVFVFVFSFDSVG